MSASSDTSRPVEAALGHTPTARAILETAARLFMQYGYRAVSITDIVNAAGITKPTLYYHFPDKETLFAQMGILRLVELHSTIEAALAGAATVHTQLVCMAGILVNASDGDMHLLRHEMSLHLSVEHQAQLAQAFQQHLFEPIRRIMAAGLESGVLARHSAAELAMLFLGLMEAFHGFSDQAAQIPGEAGGVRARVFAPESLVDLFFYGVSGTNPAGA